MNNRTLNEYLGRSATDYDSTIATAFRSLTVPYNPEFKNYVGLEIEIEGVIGEYSRFINNTPRFFTVHSDGSLRNNGIEFVSFPMDGNYVKHPLNYLFSKLEAVERGAEFTDRCSIHVHLNVLDMTWWQFESLFQLYLIFEDQFYAFAGDNRIASNFCIPLRAVEFESWFLTNKSKSWTTLLSSLPALDQGKYAGLNVSRVCDIGTVEFRHLPGTKNVAKIQEFVNLILALKRYAMIHTKDQIDDMLFSANSISSYDVICRDVFGPLVGALFPTGEFKQIEEGITTAKRLYFQRAGVNKASTFRSVLKSHTLMEKIGKVLDDIETTREQTNEILNVAMGQLRRNNRQIRPPQNEWLAVDLEAAVPRPVFEREDEEDDSEERE